MSCQPSVHGAYPCCLHQISGRRHMYLQSTNNTAVIVTKVRIWRSLNRRRGMQGQYKSCCRDLQERRIIMPLPTVITKPININTCCPNPNFLSTTHHQLYSPLPLPQDLNVFVMARNPIEWMVINGKKSYWYKWMVIMVRNLIDIMVRNPIDISEW